MYRSMDFTQFIIIISCSIAIGFLSKILINIYIDQDKLPEDWRIKSK
jgi:hypothetical protein